MTVATQEHSTHDLFKRRLPGTALVMLSAALALGVVLFDWLGWGYASFETGHSLGDDPAGIGERALRIMRRLVDRRPSTRLLIPFVASVMPLFARRPRSALLLRSLAAFVLLAFVVLGAASVGFMYVPSAVLMVAAASRRRKPGM